MTASPRLMAVIVASANFMGGLDATVVATALPQMARSFGVGPVDLLIGITVYLTVQAVLLPISSWIASTGHARASAAICVRAVQVPVPMSAAAI